MDTESVKQLVAEVIEKNQKKAEEREQAFLDEAKKREEKFLKEINLLKLEKNDESDISWLDHKTITSLIADIEPFEPCDASENDNEEIEMFEEWLKRFKFAIECSSPNINDKTKVKFLMTKLSKKAFSEYNKFCFPNDVTDFSFVETTKKLHELFDLPQYSLFADRYECLRITKADTENFQNYFQRVKKALKKFNFNDLKEEQFYCLVALAGIRAPVDEAARVCILQRLNTDGESVKFEQVIGDCLNFLKIREAADSSYNRSTVDKFKNRKKK